MSSITTAPDKARQDHFVKHFMPILAKRFDYHFRHMRAAERAEAIQDCTASAWRNYQRAGDRVWDGTPQGRTGSVTPSRLGDFVAKNYLCEGREFAGTDVLDVMAAGTRRLKRVELRHLDRGRVVRSHGDASTGELLACESRDPATCVRILMDWHTISRACRPRARQVLALLARGWRPIDIARERLGVSPARVTALKNEIAGIVSHHGYGPRRWQTEPTAA